MKITISSTPRNAASGKTKLPFEKASPKSKQSSESKDSVVWSKARKAYNAVVRQRNTVASVSSNLRVGSRQFRSLLGTGLTSALGTAGMYAGLVGAALKAAAGVEKLTESVRKKNLGKALDGAKDLGSATILGLASASMFALRRTVLPFYGGIGTVRGAFNYAMGWKDKNKRRREIGALDGMRSLGLTARALRSYSPWFLTAGRALAPVAGVLQAQQGLKKLSEGLRNNDNKKELKGVVDIASAVGLTLLLTGVAATPGLAVFSVAQFAYTVYNMNSKVKNLMDKGIDRAEPAGLKALDGIRNLKVEIKDRLSKISCPFGPFPGDKGSDKVVVPAWSESESRTGERLGIDTLEICSLTDDEMDELF